MKIATGLLLCTLTGVAMAAEIKVLSAGAVEPGLRAAAASFKKQSGHDVNITFNTAPEIRKRIGAGDAFDVVTARVNLGRFGVGVAMRPGAPVPDISSSDALKRSVLEADSIVFNRASTGIYLENLLKKMGIYEQVEKKTTRYPDANAVMEHVLKGKGKEFGFGPITEILLHSGKGLKLVGPLPAEVQNYTSYSASPMAAAANAEPAKAFVRYLGSAEAKALLVAAGVD
jgi:molybdate transport system substrate-binding protein